MSPTSYQTAPSRVCVAAFYSGSLGCQCVILSNLFLFNRLACHEGSLTCLEGLLHKAFSSIGISILIDKINPLRVFPTYTGEDSKYWCYIQVSVRYCRFVSPLPLLLSMNTAYI